MVEGVSMGPKWSGGFTFGGLELEPGVLAEEVKLLELDFEVLDRPAVMPTSSA